MENTTNQPKKDYCEPMHTCEHILNQTMVRMFGCPRSMNAHIEKKKSKCDYLLAQAPTEAQIVELTDKVNEIIDQHVPVTVDFSKLPADATETLRIIRVGDYDACACIGQHVENTSELGRFTIISHDFENGRWRVRFKLA